MADLTSGLACSITTLKSVLFVFNFAFVVLGLVGSSLAVAMMTTEADFVDGVHDALWASVAVGFGATFVSLLGGLGTLRESPSLLTAYTLVMVIVAVTQFATSCALIATSIMSTNAVQAIFDRARAGHVMLGYIAARTQMLFECCGADGPGFWDALDTPAGTGAGPADPDGLLPASCCHGGLVRRCDRDHTFHQGCTPRVEAFVRRYGITIGSTGLAIATTQALGIWISYCLTRRFRNLARRMRNL